MSRGHGFYIVTHKLSASNSSVRGEEANRSHQGSSASSGNSESCVFAQVSVSSAYLFQDPFPLFDPRALLGTGRTAAPTVPILSGGVAKAL